MPDAEDKNPWMELHLQRSEIEDILWALKTAEHYHGDFTGKVFRSVMDDIESQTQLKRPDKI